MQSFNELDLDDAIKRAIDEEGYSTPTPIQSQAIPHLLEGRDLLGCAQTGTGKTAAFALPMLQHLKGGQRARSGHARSLIMTPTRELAIQIADSFRAYGRHLRLSYTVIYGGVGQKPQVDQMRRGVDVLVATPGRLLDLMGQGHIHLQSVEIFVLDEADRMLDMGFIHDVRRVIRELPERRQTLLFSATMPKEIANLADTMLDNAVSVAVAQISSTADGVDQCVMYVERPDKRHLLQELLELDGEIGRALVFTRTKHGANRLCKQLARTTTAEAIHGNKGQRARQRALENFRAGTTRVLVATDIAARGIDVEGITHVINFDIPNEPESYVHRIGRTARAGNTGTAISFCQADERRYLRDIERLIGQEIPVVDGHPYESDVPMNVMPKFKKPPREPRDHNRGGGGGGGRGGGKSRHHRGGRRGPRSR